MRRAGIARGGVETVIQRIDHPGELELRLGHATLPGVYREAVRALAREIGGGGDAAEERPVALDSTGPETLLADLLNEVLYLAEADGFLARDVIVDELADGRMRARLVGGRGTPRGLVKAATYHGLRVWHARGRWHATVVLDV
ncbi:MAG: archease [Actinomycetota bacterium]